MATQANRPIFVLLAACILAGEGLVLSNTGTAQELDRLTVFSGELRRSIEAGSSARRTTDNLNFGTDAGRRAQLTGRNTGTADAVTPTQRPAAIPLSPRVQGRAQRAAPAALVFNPQSADQLPQQNIAAEPVQSGTTVIEDADPFAPTGFRIGTFEGNVSLEQAIGYSSNVSQSVGGEGGAFSQTDVQLDLVSNWSLHELRLGLDGSYRSPFDSDEIDQPRLGLNAAHRLDLIDGITLTTSGFYTLQTQQFTDSTLAPGAVDTPVIENYGGSLELQRTGRKLQFTLRGGIEIASFADADLGTGLSGSQADLDNTEYELGVRVGYEVSPAITPFIEAQIAQQEFDLSVDRNGNRRDNNSLELLGGVAFDLGEKLQGEIAGGYVTQTFDDPLLADLDGFTLNGTLAWSPQRDTQFNLTLGTETSTSINANESGSLIYRLGLAAERQVTDRLSVDARLDYQTETNDDSNTTFGLGAGMQYWVNRFTALTADADYTSFTSDAANSDFDAFSVRAGVRFQR